MKIRILLFLAFMFLATGSSCDLIKKIQQKSSDSQFSRDASQMLTTVRPGVQDSSLFEPDFVFRKNGEVKAYGFLMGVKNGGNFGFNVELDEDGEAGPKQPVKIEFFQSDKLSWNKDAFNSKREFLSWLATEDVGFQDRIFVKNQPAVWLYSTNLVTEETTTEGETRTVVNEDDSTQFPVTHQLFVVIPASKLPDYKRNPTARTLVTARNPDLKQDDGSMKSYAPAKVNLTTNAVIDIAVFGDSVMWGQGLEQQFKYQTKIGRKLLQDKKLPVRLYNFAHSGAIVQVENKPCVDKSVHGEIPLGEHKLKRVECQMTEFDKVGGIPEVDLVLTNGCANDIGLMERVVPYVIISGFKEAITSAVVSALGVPGLLQPDWNQLDNDAFKSIVVDKCYTENKKNLIKLNEKFPNAKFLVTSYYSPLTDVSRFAGIRVSADMFQKSQNFFTWSSEQIQKALSEAIPQESRRNMVRFTSPAEGTIIWDYNADAGKIDDQISFRQNLCRDVGLSKDLGCLGAGVMHPNRLGAHIYAKEATDKAIALLQIGQAAGVNSGVTGKTPYLRCDERDRNTDRCWVGTVDSYKTQCAPGSCTNPTSDCIPSYNECI